MSAVVPTQFLIGKKAKIGLVDQGCRLQSSIVPLADQLRVSEAMQLGVDDRPELLLGGVIPARSRRQKLGNRLADFVVHSLH